MYVTSIWIPDVTQSKSYVLVELECLFMSRASLTFLGRHCVSHNAPVEYKRPCTTRAGPAEDDTPLYKLGSKPVQAVCKGESGALN